jgi:hypothetical protein
VTARVWSPTAEGSGGVFDQGDVVPQFPAEAAGRLDAGVGDHADQDNAADAVLLELQIEVGVGEAARSPVLEGNDVAGLGLEVVELNRSAPG